MPEAAQLSASWAAVRVYGPQGAGVEAQRVRIVGAICLLSTLAESK